jgi:hypothetical protein
MFKVATAMEKLDAQRGSGGTILKAEPFIEPQHLRNLRQFLDRRADRRKQRDHESRKD